MPRLPDRLLPSHLGAGAQRERPNRGWSPPLAAAAGSVGRGFPRWPRGRSRSAAGAPAVRPPRARALPRGSLGASSFPQGCDWTAPAGGAGRGGAASECSRHVTGANMAAPSGVHLLVRRGKHLEHSPAGLRAVAHSVHTDSKGDAFAPDIAVHRTVLPVLPSRAGTLGGTLTRRRDTQHISSLVTRLHHVTAWHLFAVSP